MEQYEHDPPPRYKRGGKPKRQLTDNEVKQLKTMAGLGMPLRQMAAIIGVHEDYLRELIKKSETAQRAIEEGRAITSHNVRKTAYEMAQKDPIMMKFWLKTREGFREVDRLEITGKDGKPIELTTEQRKARFKKIRRAMEITEQEAKENGEDTE